MKLTNKLRKPLSKITHQVSSTKHASITDAIEIIERDALGPLGLMLLCEDGTPFEAIFCGEEGRTTIHFGTAEEMMENSILVFSWYKLTTKYEITCYFS